MGNPFRSFRLLVGPSHDADGARSMPGSMRIVFVVSLLATLPKFGYMLSLGLYAQEQFDFPPVKVALLPTVMGCSQILAQLLIPCVLRPLSKRAAVAAGIFCGAAACMLLAVPGIPGDLLFLSAFVMAFAYLSYTLCIDMVGEVFPRAHFGEAIAVLNVTNALGAALGPSSFAVVITAFEHTSYPGGAFLTVAGAMFAGAACCALLPTNQALFQRRMSNSSEDSEPLSLQAMSTRSRDG